MNITGKFGGANRGTYSDAFTKGSDIAKAVDGSDWNYAAQVTFKASDGWTGKTSAGTSHTHSFSSSATIGSGDYTRPNSCKTLYYIKF